MSIPGSYSASTFHRDIDSELRRLQAQVELTWKKEARNLEWLGLADGMRVLELGSGPGFSTEKILTMLPNSMVKSVELDPRMVQEASMRLHSYRPERLTIIEASAADTGLSDNSVDFAIARLLFQHLPDPVAVVKEVFRVLKPGGKIAITDPDIDLFWLLDPPIAEADLIRQKLSQGQAAQSGDFHIGHKLWRILKSAGFEDLNLEMIAAHSDDLGMEALMLQFDPDLLLNLVKAGLLSEAEFAQIKQSREAFLNSPDPFLLYLWWMVSGAKGVG